MQAGSLDGHSANQQSSRGKQKQMKKQLRHKPQGCKAVGRAVGRHQSVTDIEASRHPRKVRQGTNRQERKTPGGQPRLATESVSVSRSMDKHCRANEPCYTTIERGIGSALGAPSPCIRTPSSPDSATLRHYSFKT